MLSAEATRPATRRVAEADVKAYYEQNKGRYGVEEQRRASHILITPEGGDKAAARKKAEAALAALKANPGDFAKIAKEQSKDPGSAAQGGDLGFFGKGMMVKPFEDVAFSLKQGETSEIVETDFGFHIIRVTEIKPAQVKPLAEVRAEIETELRTQQAQKRFAEAAEQFTNLIYEQADSLQPAADKLGLKIATQDDVTRAGIPAAAEAAADLHAARRSRRCSRRLPSRTGATRRRSRSAPNTLVSARVVEHRPAAVRPLDEVKALIRQRLEQQEAAKLARSAGEARLAELLKQPSDAGFSPPITVSRRAPQGMPPDAAQRDPANAGRQAADLRRRGSRRHGLPDCAGASRRRKAQLRQPAQRDAERRALLRQAAAADEARLRRGAAQPAQREGNRPELRRDARKPAAAEGAATK